MGVYTNYVLQKLQEKLFIGTAYTFPTTLYIGLCTSTPTQVSTSNWGVTEPSTGSYARVAMTVDGTHWADVGSEPANGFVIQNNATITFPTSTAAWLSGTALNYGLLWDAATTGNLLAFAACSPAQTVAATGVTLSIAVGALTWTIN